VCECVRNLGGELELAVSLEDLAQLAPLRLKHALRLSLSIFLSLSPPVSVSVSVSVSLSLCLLSLSLALTLRADHYPSISSGP
jgi:hypothetical protein